MSAKGSDASRRLRRREAGRERRLRVPQSSTSARPVRRRQRSTLVWLSVVVSLLGIAFGVGRLYTNGYFTITNVEVAGADHVGADQVRATARIDGQNYFLADPAAAAARARTLPWVKDARISISFPHSASIVVTERIPAGIWRIGGVNYLISADGIVLDSPSAGVSDSLPVVDASRLGNTLQVGDHVDPDPILVAAKLAAAPSASVAHSVSRLDYDNDDGLTATTDKGLIVRLGDGEDLDYKLAVWQATVGKVPVNRLHELDLRNGDRPFYK